MVNNEPMKSDFFDFARAFGELEYKVDEYRTQCTTEKEI